MWWRRKPVMAKNLTGLSVMTDEHLDYLAELYQEEAEFEVLRTRISFGRFVELTQKIQWEA